MRHHATTLAALASAGILGTNASLAENGSRGPIELDETYVIIEINDTDGDAGIHFFLDGEAWLAMTITGPDGELVADLELEGNLAVQGLTELFSESSEPSFEEQPLEEFLALFPPGEYTFEGTTIGGDAIAGSAELTHILPDAPVIISPPKDDAVNLNSVVIDWETVPDPDGSEIEAYQVILELDEGEFSIELAPEVTALRIPAALLEPETEYKFEVVAREESGNQVITEQTFTTASEDAESCLADLNGDGEVTWVDLVILLGAWGNCF